MITILIPTYNRPGYLKRILAYYDDYRVAYNIVVADGSSDEIKKVNKETVSSFPSLRIQHLAEYSPDTHPLNRLADALKHVDTHYCVFCADDDFVTPNGISQSVDFLDKNPDFAIAHGRYISFRLKKAGGEEERFHWRPLYSHASITFSDAETRLRHHLSSYSIPTFYAVHRTDFLRVIFAETARFTDDARFGELLPSMLALIYGKMKCLEVLYVARESLSDSAGAASARLLDFVSDGTYDDRYGRFRECLATHLVRQSQLDIEVAKKATDDAMATYMSRFYSRDNLITQKMKAFLDRLDLPDPIDARIRLAYTRLTGLRRTKQDSIDVSPASEYYDDFSRIRLHVLSHSRANPQ